MNMSINIKKKKKKKNLHKLQRFKEIHAIGTDSHR